MMSFLPKRGEIVVATAAGAAACGAPLLRTLGYESAVLLAIVAGGIALRRALRDGARLRRRDGDDPAGDPYREAADGFSRATLASLVAISIPFALLVVTTRFLQGCRVAPGSVIVLFLAVPASAHFASTGLLIGAATRRTSLRAVALALVGALHAVHSSSQALTGRTIPHSIPFGFLSASGWGGVGSAGLDLPASYYAERILAVAVCPLLVGLAGAAAARARQRRDPVSSRFPGPSLALAAVPLAAALAFPSAFGLTSGAGARARALSGWTKTGHVTLRFRPGGAAQRDAGEIASSAEWDVEVCSALMRIDPAPPVTIWIYDSEDEMMRLTGAKDFLFALPWRGELHTLYAPGGAKAARHELVHVLASEWSRRPLGISWNQAMLEGTAEALASCAFCGDGFQKTAAAALASGKLTPATDLFRRTGFAWGAGSLRGSYLLASSFVGFLLERYGVGAVAKAYGGASWQQAFGKSLSSLDSEWRARLASVKISDEELERARILFDPQRYPSFFRSRCPRVGAARPMRWPWGGPGEDARPARRGQGSRGRPHASSSEDSSRAIASARQLAEAAAESGHAEPIRSAVERLDDLGLDEDATALLRQAIEGETLGPSPRAELTRALFLRLAASGRMEEARGVLDERLASRIPPESAQIYRSLLGSPAGRAIARAILLGLDEVEGRKLLRRALADDPSGPAAFIAAEHLCSFPPQGDVGAARRLYELFLDAHPEGAASSLVALRLGELALREGRREAARSLLARSLAGETDPRRKLEAEEAAARAKGLSGAEFVHERFGEIRSAP